ncbi:hypothetical protein RJT34_12707 [Clitoria ternatea]|uniref:Uncharacterized protein n=1 Tax=Clitoria ternatea TaxID=43366 RepID=A0AAN9JPF4_CLITE
MSDTLGGAVPCPKYGDISPKREDSRWSDVVVRMGHRSITFPIRCDANAIQTPVLTPVLGVVAVSYLVQVTRTVRPSAWKHAEASRYQFEILPMYLPPLRCETTDERVTFALESVQDKYTPPSQPSTSLAPLDISTPFAPIQSTFGADQQDSPWTDED